MLGLKLGDFIDENGSFIEWTEAGNAVYYDNEGNELCARCASKKDMSTTVVAVDIHEEGPAIQCTDCGDGIESNGDPEDDEPESEEHPKRTFFYLDSNAELKIPLYAVPIRIKWGKLDPDIALWPYVGGDYVLTSGPHVVRYFAEGDNPRRDALAALERLEGICPICYHVQYKGEKKCSHNRKRKIKHVSRKRDPRPDPDDRQK